MITHSEAKPPDVYDLLRYPDKSFTNALPKPIQILISSRLPDSSSIAFNEKQSGLFVMKVASLVHDEAMSHSLGHCDQTAIDIAMANLKDNENGD